MGSSDWIAIAVSVVSTVVSVGSLVHACRNDRHIEKFNKEQEQLRQAIREKEVANTNLLTEISTRASIIPYLALTLDENKIIEDGDNVVLEIGLKNIGNAPATNIQIPEIENESSRKYIIFNGRKIYGICKYLNQIFALERDEINFTISLKKDELEKLVPYMEGKGNISFNLEYSDLLGNKYRQISYKLLFYREKGKYKYDHYFASGDVELVKSRINDKLKK